MKPIPWLDLLLVAFLIVVSKWLYTGVKTRLSIHRLRKQGLAMPPWSFLFGHIPFLRAKLKQYPPDILLSVVINDIFHQHFESSELFYLDLWPFARTTLVVCNAAASLEVNRRLNSKPDEYKAIFLPQTNGPSLLSTNGALWKGWRKAMNPGFAATNLMTVEKIGDIVDSVEVFCGVLEERATQKCVFQLEDVAARCTLEVILRIATGINPKYQRGNDTGLDAVRYLMPLIAVEGLLQSWNPIRLFKIQHYNNIIDTHLADMLRRCVVCTTDAKDTISSVFTTAASLQPDKPLDQFIHEATPQIRMLLIAGNETTTSTLIYAYHLLRKHPRARRLLVEEHTRVFDQLSKTPETLRSPRAAKLLNGLPYTHAVIKETLRLALPAGAVRAGSDDILLTDAQGLRYPTADCMVSLAHLAIHTNKHSYPDAHAFWPERWLEGAGDVERGAFRPFERGARDCLGQNLAVLHLKIALLMTVRKFDVVPAYEEWDGLNKEGRPEGVVRGWVFGRTEAAVKEVHGERAYHTEKDGGAHPKDGYPCRLELLEDLQEGQG